MSFFPSAEQKKIDKKAAPSQTAQVAKPFTQEDDYCAELDGRAMDFSKIQNKVFIVAVHTGDRNKAKLLASTIRGPYDFFEMVEHVGSMYASEQHHAKVFTLEKDTKTPSMFLDEGTIDYIEANWQDILTTGLLEDALLGLNEEVIPAGIIEASKDNE
jgi:hypothetical protein